MVMSTDLQQDLAEAIVKNKSLPRYKRKNKGELIKSVGYGGLTAKKRPTTAVSPAYSVFQKEPG